MQSLPRPPDQRSEPCQLTMTLDAPKLRGMSQTERTAVLGALAILMLEAADIPVREDDDAGV